jgi:hypothetical protein
MSTNQWKKILIICKETLTLLIVILLFSQTSHSLWQALVYFLSLELPVDSYKWSHIIPSFCFFMTGLFSFRIIFQFSSILSMYQYVTSFYGSIIHPRVYCILFSHLPVDGHLGLFPLLGHYV